jgi:hypothetical protein
MIELFNGLYRMYRSDSHNIKVERWTAKKPRRGASEDDDDEEGENAHWVKVGYYSEVEDAFEGLGRDAFRHEVGALEERKEILEFKRNIVKFKKIIVAEARGIKLKSQHGGQADDKEE